MKMKNRILIIAMSALVTFLVVPKKSVADVGLFDVKKRKAELALPEFSSIRKLCMADQNGQPDTDIPKPVVGLEATEGYGTDHSANDFSWYIMVHGGRALAGDKKSEELVKQALLMWAEANAFSKTEKVHDAYYALKRALLPIIVSYTIVKDNLSDDEQEKIEGWIDPLVRMVDHTFDGDVDLNNHRYLADSVLTLWGAVVGDGDLYDKGEERYKIALDQMRIDGSLPLETRRGARALWYMRQSLTDLTVIAEVYKANGDDLYSVERSGKNLPLMMDFFLSAVKSPMIIFPYASENYIPGPSKDYTKQDLGFLESRGGKRHYMAFSHAYIRHFGSDDSSAVRLNALMKETGNKELPLIDDYVGGNATCFWGAP